MFTICCNICFVEKKAQTTEKLEFHLTTCKHILCNKCLLPECPICKRRTKTKIISKDMPPSIAEYFMDANKLMKRYKSVLQFQLEQQAFTNSYFINEQPKIIKRLKREQSGMIRIAEQLDSQILTEKDRIKKSKTFVNHYERRLNPKEQRAGSAQQKQQMHGKGSNARSTASEASNSVHTPVLSLSSSS